MAKPSASPPPPVRIFLTAAGARALIAGVVRSVPGHHLVLTDTALPLPLGGARTTKSRVVYNERGPKGEGHVIVCAPGHKSVARYQEQATTVWSVDTVARRLPPLSGVGWVVSTTHHGAIHLVITPATTFVTTSASSDSDSEPEPAVAAAVEVTTSEMVTAKRRPAAARSGVRALCWGVGVWVAVAAIILAWVDPVMLTRGAQRAVQGIVAWATQTHERTMTPT